MIIMMIFKNNNHHHFDFFFLDKLQLFSTVALKLHVNL